MKRPLLSFTIFCSIFFFIIMFCVMLGGYTNLLRAKNRINSYKELVTTQCQKRLDLLPELIELTKGPTSSVATPDSANTSANTSADAKRITGAAEKAEGILAQINSSQTPLEQDTVKAFEQSQVQLGQKISALIDSLKENKSFNGSPALLSLEEEFEKLKIAVWATSHRYNKEVRYFNDKKEIFPGFIVAKLFGLENTHFFEITTSLLKPKNLGADTGAS